MCTSQALPRPPGSTRPPVRSQSVEWASRCIPLPYTVWGARGRTASRQCPRKRVDLKHPDKSPVAASSGCSWYTYQEKESFPRLVGLRRTAKAYLSISEMLSSTNCAILAAGNVSRSAGHFLSSAAVESKRHFRFSPLRVAAGCRLCTREKGCSALSPTWRQLPWFFPWGCSIWDYSSGGWNPWVFVPLGRPFAF